MKKFALKIVSFFLLCFQTVHADMDVIPSPSSPPQLINDFAGILSVDQKSRLESKLVAFNKATSNQIVVVTINSLGNYEPAEFSFKLGNKWGIGREKLRNGILILIKPKTTTEKGRAFIATGRGLEGAIPDATC